MGRSCDRRETVGEKRKFEVNPLRIIPGDWGKIGSGWLAGPSKIAAQAAMDEAGFTSSSGTFARVSNAKKGTRQQEAIRSRFELK
jgi:hypothetical protein